jgi:pilus assembly protein CpaF
VEAAVRVNLSDRLNAARQGARSLPGPVEETNEPDEAPRTPNRTVFPARVLHAAPVIDQAGRVVEDPAERAADDVRNRGGWTSRRGAEDQGGSRPGADESAPRHEAGRADSGPPPHESGFGSRRSHVDPLVALKRKVHQAMVDALGPTLYDAELDEAELAARVRRTLQNLLDAEQTLMGRAERTRIADEVSDEILGHGPIEPLLRDPDVSEIMVNGADQIWVERSGRLYPVEKSFTDNDHLRRTIDKIVSRIGRRVDEASPMVDARLPDGSRVNAVLPPVALDGPMLTIRKFAADPLTMQDIVGFGTLTAATAYLLAACVRARLNILISGGTGSGKTTLLNVLSSFVPADERIVTIEDAAELQLRQEHVVRLEARPPNVEGRGEVTARDLMRNALRMRPDRIIVGEVRDGAALDMLQAMNTGHDGSLTTLHANSPRDALSRIETMVLMAGFDMPQRAIREQAASAIDVIVHQTRLRDGSRRVTHITEVAGMESDIVTLQDVFVFDAASGALWPTGVRPIFMQRFDEAGIAMPPEMFRDFG